MPAVLFVTWDGPDTPYLETLFMPVFRELSRFGYRFHVLAFSWAPREQVRRQERAAEAAGIGFAHVPVLRGPLILSTAGMIGIGSLALRREVRRRGVDIVMPRSILPAAMTLAARPGSEFAFAFDADGLVADERVDFGGWNAAGATYRVWREIEAQAVRVSDSVVTRTEAAKAILLARAGASTSGDKIFVIPNARDPKAFAPSTQGTREAVRADWGVSPSAPCLLFAGSIGPQYYPDEMLDLYQRVLASRADARLVFLTRDVGAASAAIRRSGVAPDRVVVRSVPADAIGAQIAAADLGLALRAPTFSQQAVSPIKIAEYLLSGVPVLATSLGGASAVTPEVGLLIDTPGSDQLERAASWFLDSVLPRREAFRVRCREVGLSHFALDEAVDRYRRVLEWALRGRRQAKASERDGMRA
jgi:glycosyltransferase involved in cell wall biosynthesis